MKREIDIIGALSYKGLPFPAGFIPEPPPTGFVAKDFTLNETAPEPKMVAALGATLRKRDKTGRMYFMPVTLADYELPNAIIGFQGKKNIVETKMVGRMGTVKELVNIDDYDITISGTVMADDFPEEELARLNDLYIKNESVVLKCALTDIFMEKDDKVIIKSLDIPEARGAETWRNFTLKLVTDKNFELTIE